MEENAARRGSSIYFLCATIKLLSFASDGFREVIDNCLKLKELKDPGNEIIPELVRSIGVCHHEIST